MYALLDHINSLRNHFKAHHCNTNVAPECDQSPRKERIISSVLYQGCCCPNEDVVKVPFPGV